MINNLTQNIFFTNFTTQISFFILLLKVLINILFAGAVAKDAGMLNKRYRKTVLVSATVWSLATLAGGVFIAALYWFIHHWSRNRTYKENKAHE